MLKKLSLAALVAMAGVSFANATPLTEAIKNVNFGGYLKLELDNDDPKNASAKNTWETEALFKFSVPVSEELKFKTGYAFDWTIDSAATQNANNARPINVVFMLQYSKNGLNAIAGKIPVVTPITGAGVGEAKAAGAIATYKVNDNITVAAAALDDLILTDQVTVGGKNTYAAAVIYKQDALAAQLWYFNVKDLIDSDIVARVDYKTNGIALHADYATLELAASGTKTQTYYNVSAAYAQDALCAKIGYAATGKDGGVVNLDADSPLNKVLPTEQITGITDTTDTNALYAKIGYNVDAKTNAFVAGSFINDNTATNADYNEYMVGVHYKYTKKMKFYAYYSILDGSNGAKNADNNELSIQAKYTF